MKFDNAKVGAAMVYKFGACIYLTSFLIPEARISFLHHTRNRKRLWLLRTNHAGVLSGSIEETWDEHGGQFYRLST